MQGLSKNSVERRNIYTKTPALKYYTYKSASNGRNLI